MNQKPSGFILAELIVSITILGILTVCFALALHNFREFNHYQWMRLRCLAAAQAQLDCVSATGRPVPETTAQALWPRLTTEIAIQAGQGQWAGLQRVGVTVKGQSFRRQLHVSLARYMRMKTPVANMEDPS